MMSEATDDAMSTALDKCERALKLYLSYYADRQTPPTPLQEAEVIYRVRQAISGIEELG
jgi:hypothetical protein